MFPTKMKSTGLTEALKNMQIRSENPVFYKPENSGAKSLKDLLLKVTCRLSAYLWMAHKMLLRSRLFTAIRRMKASR
ncbi:MAG: hypothetical protein A2Z83_08235 [Omnitrophica bacterium GWA2_52_8]|nr:MAG: hypothetical protein A2Z83_08235 [Omnitrophica bacterium GWA2_52_8]